LDSRSPPPLRFASIREESQFDQFGARLVQKRQPLKGFIECDQLVVAAFSATSRQSKSMRRQPPPRLCRFCRALDD